MDPIRDAADLLTGQAGAANPITGTHWRIATVNSISVGAGTASVDLGGVTVPAAHFLQGVTPEVGSRVAVLVQQTATIILGTIASSAAPSAATRAPAASMHRTSAMTLTHDNETADMGFQVTDYDTDSMATSTGVTITTAGIYQLTARFSWEASGTGRRFFSLYLDGVLGPRWEGPPTSGFATISYLSIPMYLTAGTDISMRAYQSSGGSLDAVITDYAYPFLAATWIGSA